MRSPAGVLAVLEVKMQTPSQQARLTARQQHRLMRVTQLLAQWEPVELHLALLERQKLQLLPVDGLTGK